MKPLALLFPLLLWLFPGTANANPYFRELWQNPAHPIINIGAFADVVNVGHSQQCTMVNVIGHSHLDGFLLIPGEDWSLLAVGYSASGTGASLVAGPSWNLAPIPGAAVVWAVDKALPNSDVAAKVHAAYAAAAQSKVDLSFGPAWVYDPVAIHGFFRVFCGAAWKF